MKSFYRILIWVNLTIILIGVIGISNVNQFVFDVIYRSDNNDNLLEEFILIRKIKVISAIVIIWILGIFLGVRTNPKKEIVYYMLFFIALFGLLFYCLKTLEQE
jgi:heme O synthase-like polyprenyltransferase